MYGYNGYTISIESRNELLERIPMVHPDVIAHHITHEFGISEKLPPDVDSAMVVAVASDLTNQAVIVELNGSHARSTGGIYHITLSIDVAKGGQPKHSNKLISNTTTWIELDPFGIEVIPTFYPFNK